MKQAWSLLDFEGRRRWLTNLFNMMDLSGSKDHWLITARKITR